MISHLDHNGGWVLMVYAFAITALMIAVVYSSIRTRQRKVRLNKIEDTED